MTLHAVQSRTLYAEGCLLYRRHQTGTMSRVLVVCDFGGEFVVIRNEFEHDRIRVDIKRLCEPPDCVEGLVDKIRLMYQRDLPAATRLAQIEQILKEIDALKK